MGELTCAAYGINLVEEEIEKLMREMDNAETNKRKQMEEKLKRKQKQLERMKSEKHGLVGSFMASERRKDHFGFVPFDFCKESFPLIRFHEMCFQGINRKPVPVIPAIDIQLLSGLQEILRKIQEIEQTDRQEILRKIQEMEQTDRQEILRKIQEMEKTERVQKLRKIQEFEQMYGRNILTNGGMNRMCERQHSALEEFQRPEKQTKLCNMKPKENENIWIKQTPLIECEMCIDRNGALYLCKRCQMFICKNCEKMHRRVWALMNHTIFGLKY